jgi:ssDNA-specific exonuclease RecJ
MKSFDLPCCADNDRARLYVGEDDAELYFRIQNEDNYNLDVILTRESVQTLYAELGQWLMQQNENIGLGDK